jgi:integrase
LEKAVKLEYISRNPAAGCELPRLEQKEIHPLEDQQVAALLRAVKGGRLELLVSIALFTGLRQSELLGLTWDCVDFQKGTLLVNKQLSRILHREESGLFLSPKSGKSRTITPAPSVLKTLKEQRRRQAEMQLKAGPSGITPIIWCLPMRQAARWSNGG